MLGRTVICTVTLKEIMFTVCCTLRRAEKPELVVSRTRGNENIGRDNNRQQSEQSTEVNNVV